MALVYGVVRFSVWDRAFGARRLAPGVWGLASRTGRLASRSWRLASSAGLLQNGGVWGPASGVQFSAGFRCKFLQGFLNNLPVWSIMVSPSFWKRYFHEEDLKTCFILIFCIIFYIVLQNLFETISVHSCFLSSELASLLIITNK